MTPEGDVKKDIDKLLKQYEPQLWWHKPVLNGMGGPCLDYHCCYTGLYFAIEAKAPDKDLTDRQEITKDEIVAAGGTVFRVRNAHELGLLKQWLDHPRMNADYIYSDAKA
jgi:hypothetical protein